MYLTFDMTELANLDKTIKPRQSVQEEMLHIIHTDTMLGI